MKKYIIGIDGGNSKTDICIFDQDGEFICHKRFGTCSHEAFEEGFAMTNKKLNDFISTILVDCSITVNDIVSAVFGLAGVDLPFQQRKLEEIVKSLDFKNFIVCNDGMLGVKAGSTSGVGVCSINGTSTVCVGINEAGKTVQVGGTGEVFGDEAGGMIMALKVVRNVYDELYRCGKKTLMTNKMLELLDCTKEDYMQEAIGNIVAREIPELSVLKILFEAVAQNDVVAIQILKDTALQLALSVAGCIRELDFTDSVNIILAGSVWCKIPTPLLLSYFEKYLAEHIDINYNIIKLQARPVAGALLWAYEIAFEKASDDIYQKIVNTVQQKLD